MPEFSVVIAVYNKEAHVSRTLQSVLNQTYTNFEIIVVNDGSTDKSEEAIKAFTDPRIKYYHQQNSGAGAARNAAIARATKPWIALLDADDIWLPDYLTEQARLIGKYPEEKVFATNSIILKNGRKVFRKYSFNYKKRKDLLLNYFEASYLDSVLHSSTTVLHKQVLEKTGYYDPSIKSGQDTDLYVRIGLHFDVVFSPKVGAYYNINESSLFESARKISEKANFNAYEKYEESNAALKKFIDHNRYSLCLIAKLDGDKEAFRRIYNKIDLSNLSGVQRLILKLNRPLIKFGKGIQKLILAMGVRLYTFR